MARRRARVEKPVEVEEEEEEVMEQDQPDQEPEAEEPEAGSGQEEDGEQRSLEFDEELSWRPAKPIPTGTLLGRLERLSKELAELDQGSTDLESLKDVASKLGHRHLLQHKDRGVRAYTACCLVDILRLYVPDAPFTDDQLKMMFTMFIKDILPALHNPTNPYDSQHKYVLMSLTDVKSILLMNEVHGADELILRLFNSTFDGVSSASKAASEEQVAKDVEIHLTELLMQLIDESGSVSASVIDAIISQFLRAAPPGGNRNREQNGNQSTLLVKTEPPAYVMAKNICNGCSDKMARYVSQYFSDVILNASRFATKANGYNKQGDDSDEEDAGSGPSDADLKSLRQAHLLIRELWRAAPAILLNVIPQIEAELSADNVHLRQIATEAIGDMVSGIGAAGPPPPPVLDPAAYPPLRLLDDAPATAAEENVLTKPYSPQSFAQTHPVAFRNFVGRRNDKTGTIRAAWVSAVGYILSTSAGGIGLSREDENELIKGLGDKLNDSEERVRLAAVKAIELFDFRDIITKLGAMGGVEKEGSIFASLADRCRDRKPAVRVDAMVLLGKLWAVAAGELAEGQEATVACLGGVPSRIVNAFYANDPDLNILLDRVMFECLIPLKYPLIKGKGQKSTGASQSQGQSNGSQVDQDKVRAERILLMLKSLDAPAKKAFFAMQARQPQVAKGVALFIQQCEAYNGGVIDGNEEKVKSGLNKTLQWFGTFFPDPLKVRADLQKFAKLNERRNYQLMKFAIGSDSDFKTVRRAINELIVKIQASSAASCLDTLIPLLYRSSSLMFNRSHLATIMDYSKNDKEGLAAVAHEILNDISQRNPDLFKAHSENLRKEIIDQVPSDSRTNDPAVVDILKAYSSYSKRYPNDITYDRKFIQVLMDYALYGAPARAAKYAVNILLAKNDDKSNVTATNLLQKVMKDWDYGSSHFLTRLSAVSQLERLAPTVTVDFDDVIHEQTIKKILRQVRSEENDKVAWVDDADVNEELQAKCLSLKTLVNQVLANEQESDAEERAKPVFKLLKTLVVAEGEFCKEKGTPLAHKKRLRLLAGQLILKLCTVRKYDDQFDAASFNKLAELVQDSELNVRRRFMEKLQNYLTRGRLRARFYTILFLVAFEPVAELKNRVETWLRSRARLYEESKRQVMEAMMGRIIPLLAHHPDYNSDPRDLADFAKYFLFYLGTVATEENISLIYKYAERVKQTRDGINPENSERLYVLSDLAQAIVRKWQEKRSWVFQAWPGKVGLPTGLYQALPSSEVAQEIAKKQYIPDELDEKLDDLIRAIDRKKKRKSMGERLDPPAKRSRTQIKTVIREKREKKVKSKKTAKPKKVKVPKDDSVPLSERRRSGRAHKVSGYAEREDEEDEAEMLQGVAEWEYEDDDDSDSDEEESELSDAPSEGDGADDKESGAESEAEEAPKEDEAPESEQEEAETPKSNGRKAATAPKSKAAKPAAKASTRSARTTRTRRGKDDMEVDSDE